jgi:RNA polymerase sigma-70 factor (ECF subfamily)
LLELDRPLAQLSPRQQQVILLVGLEGISYEETAEILAIPVGTVRSRLSLGRDILRRLLDMEERRSTAAPNGHFTRLARTRLSRQNSPSECL